MKSRMPRSISVLYLLLIPHVVAIPRTAIHPVKCKTTTLNDNLPTPTPPPRLHQRQDTTDVNVGDATTDQIIPTETTTIFSASDTDASETGGTVTVTTSYKLTTATTPIPLAETIGLIMPNPWQPLYTELNYTFGFVDAVPRPAPTFGGWIRQVQPLLILPNYTIDILPASGTDDPTSVQAIPVGSDGLCGATAENYGIGYPFVFVEPGWYMFVLNQTYMQANTTSDNQCTLPILQEKSFFATMTFSISPRPTLRPGPVSPSSPYTVFADVTTATPSSLPIDRQPTTAGQRLGIALGVAGGILGLALIVAVMWWVRKKRRMESEALAFSRLKPAEQEAFLRENPDSFLNPNHPRYANRNGNRGPPGPPGSLASSPMALRPTQVRGLDLLLTAGLGGLRCRADRGPVRSVYGFLKGQSPLTSLRSIHSSPLRSGLFGSSTPASSSTAPSPPPPTSNVDPDQPLTPFQARIAALETAAQANKEDIAAQLALLRELLEGGQAGSLAAYYDGVALAEDGSGSKALLRSEEAWGIYMEALARNGRLGDVVNMVRRRDRLLAGTPLTSTESSTTPSSTSTSSSPSLLSTISPTPTPTPAAQPSSTLPKPSFATSLLDPSASASSTTSSAQPQTGSPLNPIYVQMAPPTPQMNAWRAVRWVAGFLLWGFIILTVMSMVMENTGLLKAGPGPMEFEPEEGKVVKFSDVHGVEEAKAELEEIVEFLKNPEKFSTLGGKLPKGVLLTGPPGTGKTMLARAVAGEAEVPFLFASGSSFDEMFVGVGAKRVRELFAAARKKSPAIVFIDELDAIGSKRSAKDQHYMKQTLNQLLVELDGFEQSEGVIIIAATNFPESLDKALTRPGRFDRHVVVGLPDVRGRIEILKHHMAEVQFDVEVDPSIIARGCPGMSGADLQNLVNQAAVKASRDGSNRVQLKHFEWAKDRILMGAERRSHYVTEESKRATAYHEGGHALVALHTPGAMPLHKVTIMPRGQALGITFQLPEQDKDSYTRREYNAMIDVALGGRAAEEMIFGHDDVTSGCSSDLQRATDVAARMIRNYGFSEKVGLVAHGDEESVYLSGKKKDEIESEIRSFLDTGMSRTVNLLKSHENELHTLANALVEYETLSLDEVKQVLAGQKLSRPTTEGESLISEGERDGKGAIVEGI
ncbi:hypothetical protein CI109_105313 [Kwoniella shandongensis]|uniref:Uncharacterized protein n=1 Tax=Kwoniella shandongensis TaxID=1734106 RepID=A0A5M6BUR2_9TREE|nr:uncharacterized protein CI109_004996 [Kwoniella shandongensis]KAA5526606.1 hypothetical protein CI109_004996 [Kwoniella shandongensis]